jgi:hypothetical protein
VHEGFVQSHGAALAIVLGTMLGGVLLEAAVTARERIGTDLPSGAGLRLQTRVALAAFVERTTARTGGDSSADRGTKGLVVGALAAAIVLGWWAARAVPGARLPGNGWIWVAVGVALMWLGIALRLWAVAPSAASFASSSSSRRDTGS